MAVPPSHLLTDCRVTPRRSASCSWLMPDFRRSPVNFSENVIGEHSLSHLDALMISHPPRTWQERGGWNFVNSRLQPLRPRGFQIFARLRVL